MYYNVLDKGDMKGSLIDPSFQRPLAIVSSYPDENKYHCYQICHYQFISLSINKQYSQIAGVSIMSYSAEDGATSLAHSLMWGIPSSGAAHWPESSGSSLPGPDFGLEPNYELDSLHNPVPVSVADSFGPN
jgi:hypothetical protein